MSVRLRDRLFPETGKIRQILRKINRVVHGLKPSNIKKLLKSLKNNGIKGTWNIVTNNVQNGVTVTPYEVWMQFNDPTPEELEEERRLFYVAMTRAKKKLFITYVKEKNGKSKTPSRFIDELLVTV